LKLLSLSFSDFSPSAFSILSLSFSVSLLPPSHFFLSLSLSLLLHLHTTFSLFLCLSCSAFIMVSLSFLASSLTSSSVHLLLLIELFLNRKKPSLEMLYIFFWAFFCSSSSVHHVSFVYRLQLKSTNTCIWDFPFVLCFFCGDLFFVLSQANKYGSLCFLLRSKWFLAWSYVSGV